MSQQTEDKAANLPNPAEMAQTYAEVAQRASRILTQFMEKKAKEASMPRPTNWAWPRPSWTFPPTCWRIRSNWRRPR